MTRSEGKRCHPKTMMSRKADPPTDDGGLGDFYNNWTNSILQQMTGKFWKIAYALFRISLMTTSFQ